MATSSPIWRREFVDVGLLCNAVGLVVGLPIYLAGFWPRIPWPYIPWLLLLACVVSLLFALVGAAAASLTLRVLRTCPSRAFVRRHSVTLGVLIGAAAGALHPFLYLWFAMFGFVFGAPYVPSGFRMVTIVVGSGAVAGGLVVWLYGPTRV